MKYPWKDETAGAMYKPAMEIKFEKEAQIYLLMLIHWQVTKYGATVEEALHVQKNNIGYITGYYDTETQERVNRLFHTTHPIFGDERPSPEEAFEMGKHLGEA